jgi:hypothetical protein
MTIALIVAIIGGLVYLVCSWKGVSDFAELGRIAFFCGLLAFLMGAR